jgi:two-component system NtrC family sensor kinase
LHPGKSRQFLFAARDSSAVELGEAELETLRILSRQALLALENAQLYDELQERINEAEESQQALIQAEKMAAVGRLTASIAHEINNPLHSVRNCLHLVGRNELPEADRQEYLELASEEMDRLMRTVRQMLDFYRPGARDRKPFDINEIIDRVLNLLDAQLSHGEVEVHRAFGDDLLLVLGVENQIQQVFFNLLLNAMEAMPDGGAIYISTTVEQGNVVIFIEDTGPGISLEKRDEIFEPFVSSKEKGLGLGLTVSYGVVTAHGGTLTLLSDGERGGARFRFSLPAYRV